MTLRQMLWMMHGRQLHDWGIAGSHLSLIANCNRDTKRQRRAFQVADFVPPHLRKEFYVKSRPMLTKSALHALKPLFQGKS